eukprot:TRINITY_DN13139_c0_g1_i1.p1 TRINITY_DN13139_c0_g1~~TRINITY_DN13139_c0_g1_i1.p1  ORF type:complete len:561 (+),score=109.96 TRINITY_DN13139_c0_g1_i1:3-1685(+)
MTEQEDYQYHQILLESLDKFKFKPNSFLLKKISSLIECYTENCFVQVKYALAKYVVAIVLCELILRGNNVKALIVTKRVSSAKKFKMIFESMEICEYQILGIDSTEYLNEIPITVVPLEDFLSVDVDQFDNIIFNHSFDIEDTYTCSHISSFHGKTIFMFNSIHNKVKMNCTEESLPKCVIISDEDNFRTTRHTYIQLSDKDAEVVAQMKVRFLVNTLKTTYFNKCIVFSSLEKMTSIIYEKLVEDNWDIILATENEEIENIEHTRILLTSDEAILGDFDDSVTLVINMDVPTNPDIYFSRVLRTGKYNILGLVVSIGTRKEIDIVRKFSTMKNITLSPLPRNPKPLYFTHEPAKNYNEFKYSISMRKKESSKRPVFVPPTLPLGTSLLTNVPLTDNELTPNGMNLLLFDKGRDENRWYQKQFDQNDMEQVNLSREEIRERLLFFAEKLDLPDLPRNIKDLLETEDWTPPKLKDTKERISEWNNTVSIPEQLELFPLNEDIQSSTDSERWEYDEAQIEQPVNSKPTEAKPTGIIPIIANFFQEITNPVNNTLIHGSNFDA